MELRPFGPTGAQVPVIGQGTWQLRDPGLAAEALREGLALGMRHLDTAELYRGAEAVIRDALRGTPRDAVYVVSKVLPQNASYKGTLRACEASLRRLGMEFLDAYLLHWWGDHPIEDTMRAMAELADEGRVRAVGVSNFGVEEMEAAQAALGPRHRIACNQVQYHLLRRDVERDVFPHCARAGIAVVAYSPFGGDYAAFPRAESAQGRALARVGARHGKTPRQVALRWVTREPHVFTIPKAEHAVHTRENAGGQGWSLALEDLEELDAAFPAVTPRRTARPAGA